MSEENFLHTDAEKERIRIQIKKNLKNLCTAQNLTQQDLAGILGVSGKSTVSNYLNLESDSVPDIMSLYMLKERYGIPLDSLISPAFEPKNSFEIDSINISHYNKFLGVYLIYYLSSSKLSSIPNEYNKPVLSYAVLAVAKDNNGLVSISADAYKTFACFSFKNHKDAIALKQRVEEAFETNDIEAIRSVFKSTLRYSEGNFELFLQGNLYSLTLTGVSIDQNNDHQSVTDKIMILGFNPLNSNLTKKYIGGGMLCASVSRGRNKCPCAQLMLASRTELNEDEQEIVRRLQKHHQYFDSDKIAAESISRLQQLKVSDYEESDKETLLHCFIKAKIDDELNNYVTQLFYIANEEDQQFYQFLKDAQKRPEE